MMNLILQWQLEWVQVLLFHIYDTQAEAVLLEYDTQQRNGVSPLWYVRVAL